MISEEWRLLKPHLVLDGPLILAYSGGADSSVLLAGLVRAGRAGDLIAATYESPLHPLAELERAKLLADNLAVEHLVIREDPFCDPEFTANPQDRCYICKKRRLAGLQDLARASGATILDGTNFSDTKVFRPGLKALQEAGVRSPLAEAGLAKDRVMKLGRWLGVEDWLTPASACLATRIPYGSSLTAELVDRIGRAEILLSELTGGEPGSLRVRVHGSLARLETDPGLWPRILEPELLGRLVKELKILGFSHVSLDLEGYISGSMDREMER